MQAYRNVRRQTEAVAPRPTLRRLPRLGSLFGRVLLLLAAQTLARGVTLATAETIIPITPPASAGLGPDGRWDLVGERDGIRVYMKRDSDAPYPTGMARADVEASCVHVYHTVSDYDRFSIFIPYVRESRILRSSAHSRWVFQRLQFPGPIADRSYVIRVDDDLSGVSEGQYRVTWRLADPVSGAVTNGSVAPRALSGSWNLTPAVNAAGSCTASYVVHMDPGGAIPNWFMRVVTNRYLAEVFDAVRARARQHESAANVAPGAPARKFGAGRIVRRTAESNL